MARKHMLDSLQCSKRWSLASLLLAVGCSAAYADQPIAGPQLPGARIALGIAPVKVRAPYDVQIIREDGETMPTYALKDRFYVQGNANDRYIIRITNPTGNRVEAVVSVDGLDVIDGENGDLRKRGYVVPPTARLESKASGPRKRTSRRSGSPRSAARTPAKRARRATSA